MKSYKKNKRLLIKLLGTVSLPTGITKFERKQQLEIGILPKKFDCHHVRPKTKGGGNRIHNLAIMEVEYHRNLHKRLEQLKYSCTEADRPILKNLAKAYGGLTEDMAR